jgi:hypothetical protein
MPWTRVPDDLARRYAMQTDRDPRKSGAWMRSLLPRPLRIPAWRQVNELHGRTLMRDEHGSGMDHLSRRILLLCRCECAS